MKNLLREKILAQRDRLDEKVAKEKSEKVLKLLYSLPEFKEARSIMTYVSFRNEVDTETLIRKCLSIGKRVFIPKMNHETKEIIVCELKDFDSELVCNHFGIKELKDEFIREISKDQIDLIIVPGVAFDQQGHRLGFGGGYYDRFIEALQRKVPLIALAFEFQIVDKIPIEAHDKKVDLIITEERIIRCSP